jgi:hypothetical protein
MDHNTVALYYVGGLREGDAFVTSKGTAFAVPPLGGHLKLQAYQANDIIRRYPESFTKNPKLAERVRKTALREQENPTVQLRQSRLEQLPMYSMEELQTMMAQLQEQQDLARKAKRPVGVPVQEVQEPEEDEDEGEEEAREERSRLDILLSKKKLTKKEQAELEELSAEEDANNEVPLDLDEINEDLENE